MSRHERDNIKRQTFLAELASGRTISLALQLGTLPRTTAYRWKDEDKEFSDAWDEALIVGTDSLIDEAHRRAVKGNQKPIMHNGNICRRDSTVDELGFLKKGDELWLHEQSDTLLMFLIKRRDNAYDDAVRRMTLERQWANEDGRNRAGETVPAEAVIAKIRALQAEKAATADAA